MNCFAQMGKCQGYIKFLLGEGGLHMHIHKYILSEEVGISGKSTFDFSYVF